MVSLYRVRNRLFGGFRLFRWKMMRKYEYTFFLQKWKPICALKEPFELKIIFPTLFCRYLSHGFDHESRVGCFFLHEIYFIPLVSRTDIYAQILFKFWKIYPTNTRSEMQFAPTGSQILLEVSSSLHREPAFSTLKIVSMLLFFILDRESKFLRCLFHNRFCILAFYVT